MRTFSFSFIIIAFIAVLFSCDSEQKTDNNYTIQLNVTNTDEMKAWLMERRDGEMIPVDSTLLENGKGSFSGTIELPEFYYLSFESTGPFSGLFVEPGEITVDVDFNKLEDPVVSGSQTHKIFEDFNKSMATFDEKSNEIYKSYNEAAAAKDKEKMQQAGTDYNALDDERLAAVTGFVKQNSGSVVAAYIMTRNTNRYELDELDSLVQGFDPSISSSFYVQFLTDRVNTLKRVAVGQPFVGFEMADTTGTPVSLSSVADGKYLLVDFWAAWCRPCRAENPNVVNAYNKYHDKGFDVLGVSFDKERDKWIAAIKKDKLTWNHVSDLKGWGNAAGKLYGIQSIPQNVLISPEGIIIEKNLRGEALQDKLAEIFTEHR